MSRAYYAARYAAVHLFLARRIGWHSEWQHRTIGEKITEQARHLSWLHNVKMPQKQTFGQSWKELLENRSVADYELGVIEARHARQSLAFAIAVVEAMKENIP